MPIIFLKLGGSLITDKSAPRTLRPEVLARLMAEIALARSADTELRLVLGHGSGSFGHVEAKKYGTRSGVKTPEDWRGFAEVQQVAGLLNRLVLDLGRAAGLPLINFPPSASVRARDAVVESLATDPLRAALDHGLVPLVFGDVGLDSVRGGTIVSTEDVFRYLAGVLRPERILLAGIEPGVLTHWPGGEIIPEITPRTDFAHVSGSHAADVTGGMAGKVSEMLQLVQAVPGCTVQIFSGETPGLTRQALLGEKIAGTLLTS